MPQLELNWQLYLKKDLYKGSLRISVDAFDGFGIYGHRGEGGKVLANADLDECHGHTHDIEWDGQKVRLYHYHATSEYPYTLGCYRSRSVIADMAGPGGAHPPGSAPPPGSGPP